MKENNATQNRDETLEGLRREIDAVDSQIQRLLEERLRMVEQVAAHKGKGALPIRDRVREREVADRAVTQVAPVYGPPVRAVMRLLMALSRQRQRELLTGEPVHDEVAQTARGTAAISATISAGEGALLEALLPLYAHEVEFANLQVWQEEGGYRLEAELKESVDSSAVRRIMAQMHDVCGDVRIFRGNSRQKGEG